VYTAIRTNHLKVVHMTDEEISKVRFAFSLLRELTPNEDGYIECIEEAAYTLHELIEDTEGGIEQPNPDTLPENVVQLFRVPANHGV